MKRFGVLGVVVAAIVAGLLGARGARAGEATELWMWSAPADAPDDTEATPSYVGTMVSGDVCSAVADAMTTHMRQARKVVVAFDCRALERN